VEEITNLHIPLSSAWDWEYDYPSPSQFKFCPGNPVANSSCVGSGNTPGSDLYVAFTNGMQKTFDGTSNTMDLSPTNSGFEANSSGAPANWSVTGSGTAFVVSNVSAMGPFSANYVRLQPTSGQLVGIISDPVYLGVVPPLGATLVASTAGRTSSSPAPAYQSVQVWGYDASGNPTCLAGGQGTSCLYSDLINDGEPDPGHFRVRLAHSPTNLALPNPALPPNTRFVKVALYAQGPSGTYVDFDDVHILMTY
jgi:hypothetical protein